MVVIAPKAEILLAVAILQIEAHNPKFSRAGTASKRNASLNRVGWNALLYATNGENYVRWTIRIPEAK